MNKLSSCFALIVASFIISTIACKKIADPLSLGAFNVSITNQANKINDTFIYAINDTAVFFINEKIDNLLFYSGQPGMNINYRNRYYGKGINILKFQDSASQRTINNIGDSLHLFVLTNLKSYDSTGIANATKFDITNLVQWPTSISTGWVFSGNIDLSPFNKYDTVYIAFQALGHKSTLTAQRKFLIQNFTLSNLQLPDSAFTPLFFPSYSSPQSLTSDTLPNFSYTGWAQVDMKKSRYDTTPSKISTNYGAWNIADFGYTNLTTPYVYNGKNSNSSGVVITTNYPLVFDPGNNSKTNKIDYEGWVITSPVNLNTVRHDFPTAILKDASNTVSKGFRFLNSNGGYAAYSLPLDSTSFVSGKTYDMAFVAQNLNVDLKNEVIKHVYIKLK
ncbi:DUF5017 domain-containing protein [Parasediminibacterium sp. JCM 36343]|uniref:DUF5017 domain-containing protein n=1 Tax=Parasediminibacterium sp. JCM 36343 TaxID=3374279 RepID=UPI00397D0664